MNIFKIYQKYKIPPNLRQHMLWVAGVGRLVAENWTIKGEVDTNLITKTLLFHDMANLLLYDLEKYPIEIKKYKNLLTKIEKTHNYRKKAQKELRQKYGSDEHKAVMQIVKEIGLGKKGIEILKTMPSISYINQIKKKDWNLKICFYADFRVAPDGVTTLTKRIDDLCKRQRIKGLGIEEAKRLEGIKKYCFNLEKQIQKKTKIDIRKINNKTIKGSF